MAVFKRKTKSHLESAMFFDGSVDVARYDQVKYPILDKLTEKQLGFFWLPQEVDVTKDRSDFQKLEPFEQHVFTSNLYRQIVLDSVQGRSPVLALLPDCSIPELEAWIETWSFFETIHSRSYTHIIRNIYPDPTKVFDNMLDIPEITECAKSVSMYYDDVIEYSKWHSLLGVGTHVVNGKSLEISLYQLKKKLWMCLNSVNILEGVRFYVSFSCSWAFAELRKMEGNAKIIKFISRDENTHLAGSQTILKLLPKEDKDYIKIRNECEEEVKQMFFDAVTQEKAWAEYLFKDGSMIGLNAKLLGQYVEWITNKRMKTLGYTSPYQVGSSNPLPWTEKWIGGGSVQVAPQETEISSYVLGGVNQDVDENTFAGMTL
tara:strand:+ start:613 stop:1734 length:1122 start_codon:yes stop_codon:yes gene_type:complete